MTSRPQPDYLTAECWAKAHDRCTGYCEDGELCECACHDDRAAEYIREMSR